MKTFKLLILTFVICFISLSASAQLNFCSNTIPSASISFHLIKNDNSKSYAILNTSNDSPVILSIKGWKSVLGKDLIVLSPVGSSNVNEVVYCSFADAFGSVTLYDDKMQVKFTFANDSKLRDALLRGKKQIAFNDFF